MDAGVPSTRRADGENERLEARQAVPPNLWLAATACRAAFPC